ncbi:Neutral ceramidase [Chytriomyces hyalinus]|nr:Neutral ceramidase [Chytriomyces hyalinus]
MRRRYSLPFSDKEAIQAKKKKDRDRGTSRCCLYIAIAVANVLLIALLVGPNVRVSHSATEPASPAMAVNQRARQQQQDSQLYTASQSFNSSILVGKGKAQIDLPIGEINMMGYAELSQNANGVHLRLKARAFIFANLDTPHNRVVTVVADLGFMSSIARQEVIQRLNEPAYQNPATKQPLYTLENVMISVTHTHSGPGGFADDFLYQITSLGRVPYARESVVDAIVSAIQKAHQDLTASLADSKSHSRQTLVLNSGFLPNAGLNRSPVAYLQNPDEERARYEGNVDQRMVALNMWKQVRENGGVRKERVLTGHLNWFAVHGTSLHSTNLLVSGDNKGFASYIWELEMAKKSPNFIAAFAQSNSGDVSPNLIPPRCLDTKEPCDGSKSSCRGDGTKCVGLGPGEDEGKDDFYSAEYIGRLQYEKARHISEFEDGLEVRGPVLFRHAWVDMSDLTVKLQNGNYAKTCKPAMGYSFVAGTTDGKGIAFSYQGFNRRDEKNMVLGFLRDFLNSRPVSSELERCHAPKPILLNSGDNMSPYPWQPQVLPVQMFVIGRKLALIGQPSEMSTMAGRRLRSSIKDTLVQDSVIDKDAEVVVVGLANAYSSYVTTFEEYQVQRYEGASTIFGPHTLTGYQNVYQQMAESFTNSSRALVNGNPPGRPETEVSLLAPVVLDAVRPGSSFGLVIKEPERPVYSLVPKRFASWKSSHSQFGDGSVSHRIKNVTASVSATFWCAHPRNGAGYVAESSGEPSFMTVERHDKVNDTWHVFLTDAEWDTRFTWSRSGIAESVCKLQWDVGRTVTALPGLYRFRIYGVAKTLFGERKYSGTSAAFALVQEEDGLVLQ